MRKHSFRFATLAALVALATIVSDVAWAQSKKKPPPSPSNGWSGATAISPVCQPDPTRGSQLNDVAVNANGLAVAAWDQYTYNNGGPYTIGVAVQSAGRWEAPFTISGTTGFSMNPKVAVGTDRTGQDFCDGRIHVAVRQRAALDEGGDVLGVAGVATDINQTGLDDVVARLRRGVVAAVDDVGFEHVVVAQNVLLAIDLNQRTERAAAAITVGEVFAPTAGCAELDGRCLFDGVAHYSGASGPAKSAELVGQFCLRCHATQLRR